MPKNSVINRIWNVQRKDGAEYVLIVVTSFALSIALVRLFLNLTGFPKIGSGPVHISHVLWGGLLLFAAALAVLAVDNRPVYKAAAALAGAGAGLFIDEVGKFITSDYDYFAPDAAPIVYLFFLVTLLLYLRIRNRTLTNNLIRLSQALELIQEDLIQPLPPAEWSRLNLLLEETARGDPAGRQARLAQALRAVLEEAGPRPARMGRWQAVRLRTARWLTEERLRVLLAGGLALLGVWLLKNPLQLQPELAPEVRAVLLALRAGPEVPPLSAPGLYVLRLGLEAFLGMGYLAAAVLLALRRSGSGIALGYLASLLSILVLDILVFYFEQFSTIFLVTVQFLVLVGLLYSRRRYPALPERISRPARIFLKRVELAVRLEVDEGD